MKPEDYYYKMGKGGKKLYYMTRTETRISVKNINPDIIQYIKELEEWKIKGKKYFLLKSKEKIIENKIKYMNENLQKTKQKLNDVNISEEEIKKYKEYSGIPQFDDFKKKFGFMNKPPDKENILIVLKIETKNQWKDWMKENHPDKGGNSDLCASVISAGRERGW